MPFEPICPYPGPCTLPTEQVGNCGWCWAVGSGGTLHRQGCAVTQLRSDCDLVYEDLMRELAPSYGGREPRCAVPLDHRATSCCGIQPGNVFPPCPSPQTAMGCLPNTDYWCVCARSEFGSLNVREYTVKNEDFLNCAQFLARPGDQELARWRRVGSSCSSDQRPCCIGTVCTMRLPCECIAAGGVVRSNLTSCASTIRYCCRADGGCQTISSPCVNCPTGSVEVPLSDCQTRACCLPDESCVHRTPCACRAAGGASQPELSCNSTLCGGPRACCGCGWCCDLSVSECRANSGNSQGAGTSCSQPFADPICDDDIPVPGCPPCKRAQFVPMGPIPPAAPLFTSYDWISKNQIRNVDLPPGTNELRFGLALTGRMIGVDDPSLSYRAYLCNRVSRHPPFPGKLRRCELARGDLVDGKPTYEMFCPYREPCPESPCL
jgi:hypothetical protein